MAGVYALWHGGNSYAPPSLPDHLELFPSVAAARDAFTDRHDGRSIFPYVHRPSERGVETPAVDADATMHLFLADPTDSDDPYPDLVVTFGPRGGVRVERA